MTATICPSTPKGTVQAPPSKSVAHRMLICAALAGGASTIAHMGDSEDIKATLGALTGLGADIRLEGTTAQVQGIGGLPFSPSKDSMVHCNESGSTLRFLIPLFSLLGSEITFTGAPRLFQRPLTAYSDFFAEQGLPFALENNTLSLHGPLKSGHYTLAGNLSSQFVSGLLFALPLLQEGSTLHITPPLESYSYIQLTRTVQNLFGITSQWLDEYTLLIPGRQSYRPGHFVVEGDWSQAAVPVVMGAVCGNISIAGLLPDSLQGDKAILSVLQRCGAQVQWDDGLLCVSPGAMPLTSPGDIDLSDCPDLGPVLSAMALFCTGTTHLVNAGRLRLKESDRIAAVEAEFQKMGARISSTSETVVIEGHHPLLSGQTTLSHNDHRIVMALCAAAVCGGVALTIKGAGAITKSWPGFFKDLATLGVEVKTT